MLEVGEHGENEEERKKLILQNTYKSFEELLVRYDTTSPNIEFTDGMQDPTDKTRLQKEATLKIIRSIVYDLKNNYDPDNFKNRLKSILKSHRLKFGDETYNKLESIINNA